MSTNPATLAAAALPLDCSHEDDMRALTEAGGDPGDPLQLAEVFAEIAVRQRVAAGAYATQNTSRTPGEPHILQIVYESTAWPISYIASLLGWKAVTVQTYTSGRIKKPLTKTELKTLAKALEGHARDVDQALRCVQGEMERHA